jgi:hypothetical protein
MIITSNTDFSQYFTESFLNQLLTTNYGKLWNIFATRMDEIDSNIVKLKNILSIYDNSGANLDQIGTLVKQDRIVGQTDDMYRLNLLVAIISQFSGGTLRELVEIGKIVAGNNNEAVFRPYELWREVGHTYLDATGLLNGHGVLSPDNSRPASLRCTIEGDINILNVPLDVGVSVDKIRAGGIYAIFQLMFKSLLSDMTLYAGNTMFPHEIALGDGATREPLPGDTGLQNELYRAVVAQKQLLNGDWQYSVYIDSTELNSYSINEMALFDNADVMIAKCIFTAKPKTSSFVYYYSVIDDL